MGTSHFLCVLPLTLMIIQSAITISAAPSYIYQICQDGGNFTSGSKFQANLNNLLSSLSSDVLTANNGFSNETRGNKPDRVHGLFLCRGDQTNDACQTCVTTAAEEITKQCPNKKDAIIYYDECMVRYSNQSIFSMVQKNQGISLFNTNNASDPAPSPASLSPPTTAPSPDSIAPPPLNPPEADHSPAPAPDSIAPPPQNPTEDDHPPAPSPASRSTPPFPESLAPPPRNSTNGKGKNTFNNLLTLIMPLVVTLVLATGNCLL